MEPLLLATSKHPNSRPVTIYRAGSFLTRAQGKEIEEYFELSKVSVGSFWPGDGSQKVATGIDYDEQNLLMPFLINVEAGERGFRAAVEEYFHAIDTRVPHRLGMTLETGLKRDNTKDVAMDNMPLNIDHYVRWRHHRQHPKMAISREEAEGNALKEYYMFDPNAINATKSKDRKEKEAAMQIYLKLANEAEKVDMMLLLMGFDPREFVGPDREERKMDKLKELSENKAVDFVEVYQREDMDVAYSIESMIKCGVILQIGSRLIEADTKKLIGHNRAEAIAYFQNPGYENDVIVLKAKWQEAKGRPLQVGARTTVLTAKQAASQ